MMSKPLAGKVCLVTGATQGIGRATAERLAALGAILVMVGRSPEKTRRIADAICRQTHSACVDYFIADLSSQASIHQLATVFKQRYDNLHILINNAGGLFMNRTLTADGLEMTFALNHLGCFLLTNLLLDLLKASVPVRIVNVSSHAHTGGHLAFDDLMGERRYNGMRAYSQSKLANVVFTYELARRLEGTGVTANALHPGTLRTGFMQNNPFPWNLGAKLFFTFMPPASTGADAIVYLATSPELEGVTGKYFDQMKLVKSAPESYDEDLQRRLWEESAALTGLKYPP